MGNRELEFEENAICDICGKLGATDFLGDYFCNECFTKEMENVKPFDEVLKELDFDNNHRKSKRI